jgi:hypothetical protein
MVRIIKLNVTHWMLTSPLGGVSIRISGNFGSDGLIAATSNTGAGDGGKPASASEGFCTGFRFTLSTTITGVGTGFACSFSPSCRSIASKTAMPSLPAAASLPRGVYWTARSHAPVKLVSSITGLGR